MKIAQVVMMDSAVDRRYGHTYYLSKAQLGLGHKVDVLTSALRTAWEPIPNRTTQATVDGINVFRYKYPIKFGDTNAVCPQIFFKILKEDYDVVHSHYLLGFIPNSALLATKFKRTPYIVTQHWELTPSIIQIRLRAKLQSKITPLITKIIALTPSVKKNLLYCGFPAEKIEVIPSGVNTEMFNPKNGKKEWLKKLGVPSGNKIILFVGRLDANKRVDMLLIAFAKLKEKNVNLLVIGGGPLESKLREIAKRLNIANKVIFIDFLPQEQLAEVYPLAYTFVLPSKEECLGLVLLESIAAGVPILTTPTAGGKFVFDSCGGLLFEDVVELGLHLKLILNDENLRNKLSKDGLQKIQKFSWSEIAKRVEKVYS